VFADQHILDLAAKRGVKVQPLKHSFHHEYRYATFSPHFPLTLVLMCCVPSAAKLTVAAVDSLEAAIDHVNTNGSGHTDAIICKDPAYFLRLFFRYEVSFFSLLPLLIVFN